MRFLCVNCNGVRSKKAEIENLLRYTSADVVLLSEIKTDDSVYTAEFLPSGYKGFQKDRTSSGGGVMVVVKDCFTALEIPMADVTGEVCWVKIDTKDNPLYVAHSIEVLLITHQNSCWNWKSLLRRSPN